LIDLIDGGRISETENDYVSFCGTAIPSIVGIIYQVGATVFNGNALLLKYIVSKRVVSVKNYKLFLNFLENLI
jgi:hypothetical protein